MPRKVTLTYFKPTGKYYTEGTYISELDTVLKIWDEVDRLIETKPPGLSGPDNFLVLVTIDNDLAEDAPPRLTMPDRMREVLLKEFWS